MKTILMIWLMSVAFQLNLKAQSDAGFCRASIDSLTKSEYYLFVDSIAKPKNIELTQLLTKTDFKKSCETVRGTIILEFIVTASGEIVGERIITSLLDDDYYARQYLNLIKSVEWNPAVCKGNKVPYKYVLPIHVDFQ